VALARTLSLLFSEMKASLLVFRLWPSPASAVSFAWLRRSAFFFFWPSYFPNKGPALLLTSIYLSPPRKLPLREVAFFFSTNRLSSIIKPFPSASALFWFFFFFFDRVASFSLGPFFFFPPESEGGPPLFPPPDLLDFFSAVFRGNFSHFFLKTQRRGTTRLEAFLSPEKEDEELLSFSRRASSRFSVLFPNSSPPEIR